MKSYFRVTDGGKLPAGVRDSFVSLLKSNAGKDCCLTFERKRKKRTNPQLEYYYGYCIPTLLAHFHECGYEYSKEELDQFIRLHVIKCHKIVCGQIVPGHTGEWTPAEFSDRMELLRAWASDVYCELELPGEHLYKPMGVRVG